jgi:hypothetical protein
MELSVLILFSVVCQQISATSLPASLSSAISQLAELKTELDADIARLSMIPTIATVKPMIKASQLGMSGKVPDFAGRKALLATLNAKLVVMQEQVRSGQLEPHRFLIGMKQVLEESSRVEMKVFENPTFKLKSYKMAKSAVKVVKKPLDKIALMVSRNVENFTAEMYRLHNEATNFHGQMLELKHDQRKKMTNVVFEVFSDVVQLLGETLVLVI